MTKEEFLQLRGEVLNLKKLIELEKLLPHMSAYQFLHECNDDNLDACAINYLGRKFTFRELFEKIDIAAKGFAEMGVKPGDKVAMAMLSTPEAIISFYALNKIGATTFMISASHDKASIREELKDSGASVIVINDIFYDKEVKEMCDDLNFEHVVAASLDESMPLGFWGDKIKFKLVKAIKSVGNACNSDERCIRWNLFEEIGKKSNIEVLPYYEDGEVIVIASTSGSTGKPKRPMLTNENINAMPVQMGMSCDVFTPGDSIFTTLPIWIVYSLFNSIHEPLCLGVTVDLDPLFNSKKVSKRLRQYRFNHWNAIPSYLEDMIADRGMKGLDLRFLKSVTTGGDFRSPKLKQTAEELFRRLNSDCEAGQGYGLTETGGGFGYTYERGVPAESVGKPLVGNAFKIVDVDSKEELGPEQSGQLYLYSPSVMKGYYNEPELTEKVLETDADGVTWYVTEDMAHYDSEGQLFIDGRIRRIEISRDSEGNITKVFPDRVKQVVSLHPAIEQCEVVMVPDEKRVKRPVAFVVLKENYPYNDSLLPQIDSICSEHNVESYMFPTECIPIEEIPKTDVLKVDYDRMLEMYLERSKTDKKSKLLSLFKKRIS